MRSKYKSIIKIVDIRQMFSVGSTDMLGKQTVMLGQQACGLNGHCWVNGRCISTVVVGQWSCLVNGHVGSTGMLGQWSFWVNGHVGSDER